MKHRRSAERSHHPQRYDGCGAVWKRQNPGSKEYQRMLYDAVGRMVKSYTAYYDQTPSEKDVVTFAVIEGLDALMAQDISSGEIVMQQSDTTYDNASNAILQLVRDRFHDATGDGELTTPAGARPKAPRATFTTRISGKFSKNVSARALVLASIPST